MSLDLYVYKLDIAQLRAVQGSGNRALLERVLSEQRELIEEQHETVQEEAVPHLRLGDALEQIIQGKIDETLRPLFQYEHAAALIAATLGDPLDPGLLRESHGVLWGEADVVLHDRLRRAGFPSSVLPPINHLLDRGPALDVPIDPLNPLGTGYLLTEEVKKAHDVFKKLDLEDDSYPSHVTLGDEALEVVQTYSGWVAAAVAADLGLFFHA